MGGSRKKGIRKVNHGINRKGQTLNYKSTIGYFIITGLLIMFQYCSSSKTANQSNQKNGFIESESGLQYKVLKEGTGEPVKIGQEISIHETMSYTNDSLLFDSRKLPNPVKVLVGGKQVIKGIDEALVSMKKGEVKKLIISPALSKRTGVQTFPHPDSTLIYEIELIDILKK